MSADPAPKYLCGCDAALIEDKTNENWVSWKGRCPEHDEQIDFSTICIAALKTKGVIT